MELWGLQKASPEWQTQCKLIYATACTTKCARVCMHVHKGGEKKAKARALTKVRGALAGLNSLALGFSVDFFT